MLRLVTLGRPSELTINNECISVIIDDTPIKLKINCGIYLTYGYLRILENHFSNIYYKKNKNNFMLTDKTKNIIVEYVGGTNLIFSGMYNFFFIFINFQKF